MSRIADAIAISRARVNDCRQYVQMLDVIEAAHVLTRHKLDAAAHLYDDEDALLEQLHVWADAVLGDEP